uniref:hypothetical protein n=1 Tax=Panacagrimonas sp. TaxID=2480088 RepID=UPI003B523902
GNDELPRIQIQGEIGLSGELDFFAFELLAGETITLDIDDTVDGLDAALFRLLAQGGIAQTSLDAQASQGGTGSPRGPGSRRL